MAISAPPNSPIARKPTPERSPAWKEHASRVEAIPTAKPTGWLCVENRAIPMTEIDLLEIVPGRGVHIRTRQESWLISLPEELQSDELLRAITSGEVNCLSGSCEPCESSSGFSKPSSSESRDTNSVLVYE